MRRSRARDRRTVGQVLRSLLRVAVTMRSRFHSLSRGGSTAFGRITSLRLTRRGPVPESFASPADAFDPDADDLTAALAGDAAAFTRLFERFQPDLLRWAMNAAPDLAVFDRFPDAASRTWELLLR